MSQSIRAIIFDMDGVLVDSEPLHYQAYKELIDGHGGQYEEDYNNQFLGQKDIEIAPQVIDKFKLPYSPKTFVERKDKIFYKLIRQSAIPMKGVVETLQRALSLNLGIGLASSSRMTTIDLVVDTLKIRSYFHNLTSGDEVRLGKPNPDIFLLSAKRLRTEPQQCLVIEDTEAGVMAAKCAGMQCVAIPCSSTSHQKHEEADFKLASLQDLDLNQFLGNTN